MKSCFALLIALASAACAQSTPASSPGLLLLQRVAETYAAAKSYHIEATTEVTRTNELEHFWTKTIYNAASTQANRYRYEARTPFGSMTVISDGKTEWAYLPEAHQCTQTATPAGGYREPERMSLVESELSGATGIMRELATLAKPYKSATQLTDETITLNGRAIECAKVRVSTQDRKRAPWYGVTVEKTFWIDMRTLTVVRTFQKQHSFNIPSPGVRIAEDSETDTTYPVTELDGVAAYDKLFVFTPPPDARRVTAFPDSAKRDASQWVGQPTPAVTLTREDGTPVALTSFRGKPLLIDFWATWCGPCVQSLPKLAELYRKTRAQGLAVLTVDEDEEPKAAADFLASAHDEWPNFHDDGQALNAFVFSGIPRTILVDAAGKVVYDETGWDDDKLLAAVAALGPEYASLAPKPKPQEPCAVAAK